MIQARVLSILMTLSGIGYVMGFGCFFFGWDDGPVRREILLPLLGMRAKVDIIDGIADVSVQQFFVTTVNEILPDEWDSKYEIPIDEQASVYSFKARYLDRVIDGIVKSDEEAKEDYAEALDEGKPAFLGEQTDADTFKIEFGNVPRDIFLTIEIAYVAPVQALNREKLRFVIPLTLAPELTPTAFDETAINNDVIEGVPFENGVVELELTACSSTGSILASSPTHPITITDNDGCEVVNMVDRQKTRRDVVILLETDKVQEVEVDVYRTPLDDGTTALMLSLLPDTSSYDSLVTKNEFIFLVDRSGSMQGERMQQTSIALNETLHILPDDALFNIIGFGGTFQPIFEDSQPKSDDDSFLQAQAYANTMTATFGGTDLLEPIEYILGTRPAIGYQRNVFVLTDGELNDSEVDEIVTFVEKNRATTRFFSIGIGDEVNREIINGLARAGVGTAEYVDSNKLSAISELTVRQVEIASQASFLSRFDIQWGSSNNGIEAPYGKETVFADRRTLIYYLTKDEAPSEVRVTALVGGLTEIEYAVPQAVFKTLSNQDLIPKMAAREAIRDLEEGRSILSLSEDDNSGNGEITNEIIRIGVKYQITSSETTFVAIDNQGWTSLATDIGNGFEDDDTNGGDTNGGDGGGGAEDFPAVEPAFGALCFSSENKVLVANKGYVSMKHLEIGDMVQVGVEKFSPIYSFGHYSHDSKAEYLQLYLDNQKIPLEISKDHMVFSKTHGPVPAFGISIGDYLVTMSGEGKTTTGKVKAIKKVNRIGAFAPFTETGTIVVSGVLASNYVSLQYQDKSGSFVVAGGTEVVSMQWLAHAFQIPHRLFCRGKGINSSYCSKEKYTKEGISYWVYAPFIIFRWSLQQHVTILTILSFPILLSATALQMAGFFFLELDAAWNNMWLILTILTMISVRAFYLGKLKVYAK